MILNAAALAEPINPPSPHPPEQPRVFSPPQLTGWLLWCRTEPPQSPVTPVLPQYSTHRHAPPRHERCPGLQLCPGHSVCHPHRQLERLLRRRQTPGRKRCAYRCFVLRVRLRQRQRWHSQLETAQRDSGGREDTGRADSELGTLPERGDAQTHTWSKGNRDHRGMERWDTAGEQGSAP